MSVVHPPFTACGSVHFGVFQGRYSAFLILRLVLYKKKLWPDGYTRAKVWGS